jgi:DNA-binding CsgD family transcriptional regulator
MPAETANARVASLLPDLYALKRADEFPAHALGLVRRAVGGNKADYTQLDLVTGDFQVLVDPVPPQLRALADARRAHMLQHPVLHHFRQTAVPDARLISDFLTPKAFRRLGLYGDFFAHLGVEDQLTVLVSAPESTIRAGISIDRDRPAFADRDRRLLDGLAPHLRAARDNAARFSDALAAPSEGGVALDRLTDRQRDVLAEVSRGLTDAQIALELDISPHTVRKHVEHILSRLGTPTRTAAAALYLTGSGVVGAPEWTASIGSFVAP